MAAAHRASVFQALGLVDWRVRAGGALDQGVPANTLNSASVEAASDGFSHAAPASGTAQDADSPCAGLDWAALEAYLGHMDYRGATQSVFGIGTRDAEVLIVGEAPGEQEDRYGEPFVGRAGKLLDKMLAAIDCSRAHNVYITNICKFRPPGNRDPNADEVATDWPVLERQIELMNPRLVVATGRVAAQTLLATKASLARLRQRIHRYPGRELEVIVTYHPAFLLRSPQQKAKAWADLCLIADRIACGQGGS